jgi:DNA polymerase III subunit epsilon
MFDWIKRSSTVKVANASDETRLIALDLETTGLDPKRDRIIEIGAVAIVNGEVALDDYFHRVLATSGTVSIENRVVHGVTAAEQYSGANMVEALDALLLWMRDSRLIGFHTTFDMGFIRVALAQHTGRVDAKKFGAEFLDLAVVAPIVFPEHKARSLGEWSAALKLPIRKQHRALADALATAHLLQKIRAALPSKNNGFAALKIIEEGRHWL